MRIVGPNGSEFTGRFRGLHGQRAYSDFGLALPRETLDALLVQEAVRRGARLREEVRADVTAIGDGFVDVTARGAHGADRLRARMVVAADGLNSRVARRLKLARRHALRRVALVAHMTDVAGMGDVGEMHVGTFGYVGLASIGGGVTNVAVVADLDRCGPALSPIMEWFRDLLTRFPAVAERMRSARLVSPVRAVGPFARWTTRATFDHGLLAGDAADFHDPFTGEGIFAALHGGELASTEALRALESGRFAARDLAHYDRARAKAFRGKWVFERLVAGAVGRPALFERIAGRLSRRQYLADLMIGVAGDFIPVWRLFRPWNAVQLVI
jgi:flavin-dependent dehydrogenase